MLTTLLLVNVFLSGLSSMTVTSRIGYAIARDKGFPYSKYLAKLNTLTCNPDRMIILVFFLSSVLCLLPLISSTAFAAITGITTVGY